MKRLIVIVFAIALSGVAYGQGLDLGVKLGANFSNITDASGLKNKTGFVGGAFLGIKFNDHVAIQPELLYSQQGADFDPEAFDLNYINIPVVLKYYLVQGLNVQLGPQFGFLIDDNIGDSIGDAFETESFDLSGIIGAGYDLPLGFRIDARYNFGLTDVFKRADGKNGVFSLALGYSFL